MDLPELEERWWVGELRDGNIYISSSGALCLSSCRLAGQLGSLYGRQDGSGFCLWLGRPME